MYDKHFLDVGLHGIIGAGDADCRSPKNFFGGKSD